MSQMLREYKCRKCGALFARGYFYDCGGVFVGSFPNEGAAALLATPLCPHRCHDGKIGIGELIGCTAIDHKGEPT